MQPQSFLYLSVCCNHTQPLFSALPPFYFIKIFIASITELSSPLLNTSVVDPLVNDLLRLVSYPTSTHSVIKPTSYSCILFNPCWNPSYVSLVLIWSPSLSWNRWPTTYYFNKQVRKHKVVCWFSVCGTQRHYKPYWWLHDHVNRNIICAVQKP